MSNFMMNLISWILLLLVILTLYLIDKVNQLTRLQEEAIHPSPPPEPLPEPEPPGDILFAGLEGKTLWDAMSGKQIDGFEPTLIEALRPHYEQVLRDHIETTFKDGLEDTEEAEPHNPGSLRVIPTPRGEVESWLPPQHLGSIYRTAMDFGQYLKQRDPDTFYRLQETLDSVTSMLYQRAGLSLEVPFSELLMDVSQYPAPPAPAADDEVLALTDDSSAQDAAATPAAETDNATGDSAEADAQTLAQGLEQVQEYEAQQRQDLAAEEATEVLEPVMPAASAQPVAVEEKAV